MQTFTEQQIETQKSVLSTWLHRNSSCVINDPRYYFAHPMLNGEDIKPKWFEHLPGRSFIVDTKGYPNIGDPLVAKWIMYNYSDLIQEEYTVLSPAKKRFYARVCMKLIESGVNAKGNFREYIQKIGLFGSNWTGYFNQDESNKLITKLIKSKKEYLACELVHLGVTPSQECISELGQIGALIEYIMGSMSLDINYTDSYKDLSTNWSQDQFHAYSEKDGTYVRLQTDQELDPLEVPETVPDRVLVPPNTGQYVRPRMFRETDPVEIPRDLNVPDEIHPYDNNDAADEYYPVGQQPPVQDFSDDNTDELFNDFPDRVDELDDGVDIDDEKQETVQNRPDFSAFRQIVNQAKQVCSEQEQKQIDEFINLTHDFETSGGNVKGFINSMLSAAGEALHFRQDKFKEIFESIAAEPENPEFDLELAEELAQQEADVLD